MTLLELTLPSPAENLALDEALLDSAEAGESGEILRFWESPELFVVVGYANKIATEVNVAACVEKNIPILRRCSGGGTVVQGPGCLNYALVLSIRENGPTRNISSANEFIMERNRAALQSSTLNPQSSISVQGHTDLALGDLKFSGNAQRRRKRFLLFHGTILYDFKLELITDLLRMPSAQPDYRNGRPHSEFIRNLKIPREIICERLAEAWAAKGEAFRFPAARVKSLVEEKYGNREWNGKF